MTKRLFDVLLSLTALLLLTPLMLIISLIVSLTSNGPVIFCQTRIGYGGKPFTIYKYRSMCVNHSSVSVTLSTDARITPVGRLLRKTKLDELPQLWNILKGDMSFVGPRPDVPGYSDQLTGGDRILWTVRPGLTGLDSLIYHNEASILDHCPDPQKYYDEVLWPQKVRINVFYIRRQRMLLDLWIIQKTIFACFFNQQETASPNNSIDKIDPQLCQGYELAASKLSLKSPGNPAGRQSPVSVLPYIKLLNIPGHYDT